MTDDPELRDLVSRLSRTLHQVAARPDPHMAERLPSGIPGEWGQGAARQRECGGDPRTDDRMVTRSSAHAPPLDSAVLSNRRASHTAHRGGQHVTSCTTLERLAAALEVKLVVGIETEAGDRELVAI